LVDKKFLDVLIGQIIGIINIDGDYKFRIIKEVK
jgi:hypothetical protein